MGHSPSFILGGNIFGYSVSKFESHSILTRAHEIGIRAIDTSSSYSKGASEDYIGEWLSLNNDLRSSWFVCSKVGRESGESAVGLGEPSHILENLHRSLVRLSTDYLDVLYLHAPDPVTPIEETLNTFMSCYEDGLIRGIGLCNVSSQQLKPYLRTLKELGFDLNHFYVQNYFNWAKRQPSYWNQLKISSGTNWNSVSYGVLGRGLLIKPTADKVLDPGRRAARSPAVFKDTENSTLAVNLTKVNKICESYGTSLFAFSIASAYYGGDSQIIATRTITQLEQLGHAKNTILDNETFNLICKSTYELGLRWEMSLGDPDVLESTKVR